MNVYALTNCTTKIRTTKISTTAFTMHVHNKLQDKFTRVETFRNL